MNKRPPLLNQKKVCIICEGYEEYDYITKLLDLKIWNNKYKFILINADANNKIPARYQDAYTNDSYDIVLIFCDTDAKPHEDYKTIKEKIDIIHGIDNSANRVTIFANPCTMQIILLHFSDIKLNSHKKEQNKVHIKILTGIGSYNARESQRIRLFNQITIENYNDMVLNCKKLSTDDNIVGSTNFSIFIEKFSSNEAKWIDEINKFLEG